MADNEEIVSGVEPVVEPVQSDATTPQRDYSDVEKQAMEQGWVPEDQWEGNGKWRSAEDFLERGEIFATMDKHRRRADRLEETVKDLKQHMGKIREIEHNKAMAALRAEKKEALLEGDADRVIEIDEAIAEKKQEIAKEAFEASRAPAANDPDPAFVLWLNRNNWYEKETAMRFFADDVATKLAVAGERDVKKILAEVDRQVRKEFSHKFTNPNRDRASAVEGANSKGKSSTKDDFQLTAEETQVMNKFVKAGVMTREEYIADIKAERSKGA